MFWARRRASTARPVACRDWIRSNNRSVSWREQRHDLVIARAAAPQPAPAVDRCSARRRRPRHPSSSDQRRMDHVAEIDQASDAIRLLSASTSTLCRLISLWMTCARKPLQPRQRSRRRSGRDDVCQRLRSALSSSSASCGRSARRMARIPDDLPPRRRMEIAGAGPGPRARQSRPTSRSGRGDGFASIIGMPGRKSSIQTAWRAAVRSSWYAPAARRPWCV